MKHGDWLPSITPAVSVLSGSIRRQKGEPDLYAANEGIAISSIKDRLNEELAPLR